MVLGQVYKESNTVPPFVEEAWKNESLIWEAKSQSYDKRPERAKLSKSFIDTEKGYINKFIDYYKSHPSPMGKEYVENYI